MDRYNLQFEDKHLSPGVGVTLSAARYEHEAIFAANKAFSNGQQEIEANVWVLQAPGSLSPVTLTMKAPSREKVPFLTADST